MEESREQPSAIADLEMKCDSEEPTVSSQTFSKECTLSVTPAHLRTDIPNTSGGAADSPALAKVPMEEEEEATPTPPESSPSPSSENMTLTIATTTEEPTEAGAGPGRGGDMGEGRGLRCPEDPSWCFYCPQVWTWRKAPRW